MLSHAKRVLREYMTLVQPSMATNRASGHCVGHHQLPTCLVDLEMILGGALVLPMLKGVNLLMKLHMCMIVITLCETAFKDEDFSRLHGSIKEHKQAYMPRVDA
jgi:hypothetical protein